MAFFCTDKIRIAASYNTPRFDTDAEGLYNLLRNATTVETDGISASLVLEQDGQKHEVEVSRSDLHIEDDGGQLKIYVPRDEIAQDVCFKSRLPRRLAQWLMTNGRIEDSLVQVINAVLDCRIAAVHRILEEEGVAGIDIADQSENDAPTGASEPPPAAHHSAARTPERSLPPDVARRLYVSDAGTPDSTSSAGEPTAYATPLTDVDDYDFPAIQSTPTNRGQLGRAVRSAGNAQYRRMLETIVSAARAASFPEFSTSGMAAMLSSLHDGEDIFADSVPPFGCSDFEGRAMIGAAGELFVSIIWGLLLRQERS